MSHRFSPLVSLSIILAAVILFAVDCLAAEHFGIPVYPGAVSDAATKRYESENIRRAGEIPGGKGAKVEIFCYRTGDAFDKVAAFYKAQKTVGLIDLSDKGGRKSALFCPGGNVLSCAVMGNGIDVTLATPWEEEQVNKDVLIFMRKAIKAK